MYFKNNNLSLKIAPAISWIFFGKFDHLPVLKKYYQNKLNLILILICKKTLLNICRYIRVEHEIQPKPKSKITVLYDQIPILSCKNSATSPKVE